MPSELIDYDLVISDLEARRKAFNESVDAAINGIRQTMAILGGANSTGASTGLSASIAAPNGYLGMSLLDAAKKALRMTRRPMTNAEIAEALTAGGFLHNSANFTNTLGTSLWRASEGGDRDIVRNGRRWLLREWAPGLRSRRNDDDDEAAPGTDPILGPVR